MYAAENAEKSGAIRQTLQIIRGYTTNKYVTWLKAGQSAVTSYKL
ncbi:hypothetical protein CLV42_102472 [Chitinophaga ginsengisoli]|uniref:Uncharacterized protein n=1 Tax=Chitinophaga ginsengisoli TaxID=363837 RepID=A0A2P8GLQ1_9BACT|nr:hypothetical protein CLV42_102472 [Chitinophaga ginsengisoli]